MSGMRFDVSCGVNTEESDNLHTHADKKETVFFCQHCQHVTMKRNLSFSSDIPSAVCDTRKTRQENNKVNFTVSSTSLKHDGNVSDVGEPIFGV